MPLWRKEEPWRFGNLNWTGSKRPATTTTGGLTYIVNMIIQVEEGNITRLHRMAKTLARERLPNLWRLHPKRRPRRQEEGQ